MESSGEQAIGWITARRELVRSRLDRVEARLAAVRAARGDWIDEEHDPEGFALTFEWQQAEGARAEHLREFAELDAAEARLRDGRYGVCSVCGAAIPDAQLERLPARTTCVGCVDGR